MTTLKADCRKFSPNIFIQTKCQNCFRTKEVHSADALEKCKTSRKISKCGYLFVAPDWDFSLYINRTKRWQRRWFVLYDDGELTYSVDEYPDTIPQAVIDMNNVLEVSDAEDITGNQFAISITANEKVHFVKGTSKEEKKWWFDVLSRFPKFTIRSNKQLRNSAYPVVKMTKKIDEVLKNNKNSRNGIINNYESSKDINNARDIFWDDLNPSNDDVFDEQFNPPNNKDLVINLKRTVDSSSPVIRNTLIKEKSNTQPIVKNRNIENLENCDKNLRISDVGKLKASILELESISEQACQLTNELVCCRNDLIQLRKKIKDNQDHNQDHHLDLHLHILDQTNHTNNQSLHHNNIINQQFNRLNHVDDKVIQNIDEVDQTKKTAQLNGTKKVAEVGETKKADEVDETKTNQNKELETIRKLNLELKEAQSNYDYLEIAYERLTKRIIEMEKVHESDLNLMKDRINDLTNKLLNSERLLRLAKQKIAKYESKQERRRSSLKGKS